MKRTAAILAAALALSVAGPALTAEASPRPRLISTADFKIYCRTMDRVEMVRVESVDFVFKRKIGKHWRTVWVAEDGLQFIIVRTTQNPPWGCVPTPSAGTPAEWTED